MARKRSILSLLGLKTREAVDKGQQKLIALQKFIERPQGYTPLPTFPSPPPTAGPIRKVTTGLANIPSDVLNMIYGRGIANPTVDVLQNIGRLAGGRPPLEYEQFKPGAAKVGAAIAYKRPATDLLADIGETALPILYAAGGKSGASLLKSGAKVTAPSLKSLAFAGAKKGAAHLAPIGTAVGLAGGRGKKLKEQVTDATLFTAFFGALGAGVGAATPYVGASLKKVVTSLKNRGWTYNPKVGLVNQKTGKVVSPGLGIEEVGRKAQQAYPVDERLTRRLELLKEKGEISRMISEFERYKNPPPLLRPFGRVNDFLNRGKNIPEYVPGKGTKYGVDQAIKGLYKDLQQIDDEIRTTTGLDPASGRPLETMRQVPGTLEALKKAQDAGDLQTVKALTDQIRAKATGEAPLGLQPGFIDFGEIGKTAKSIVSKIVSPFQQKTIQANPNDILEAYTGGHITRGDAIALGVKPSQVQTPVVTKILQALKEAKPIRGIQEKIISEERSRRIGAVLAVGQKTTGEKGFFAELGQLKGPIPKVQYDSIRERLSQADVDDLFNQLKNSDQLNPYQSITARGGLLKMVQPQGTEVPTKGEIALIEREFGSDFANSVLKMRPFFEKLTETGAEIVNIPRSLMASMDLSAPLRQGVFLIPSKPKQFAGAFRDMFKYFGSGKQYQAMQEEIAGRPTYPLMEEARLALTGVHNATLTGREEAFMSQLPERFPLIGIGVRASNRAYTGFLTKLRADVFDDLLNKAVMTGHTGLAQDVETRAIQATNPKLLSSLGEFVNTATGRGSLGAFEKAAVLLNSTFFSPRLMASRVNTLNPAYYIGLEPFVRKEALKSLLAFAGMGTAVLSLAKMAGAKVSGDWRNADFGKIKVGNTRYDTWGGFQQYMRAAGQLITGQYVSSTTGRQLNLGEGYKPLTRKDILFRFGEGKLNPVGSFIVSLLEGKSGTGDEFRLAPEIVDRFIPMAMQDMYDLYREKGLEGLVMASPALFGVGVQTYGQMIPFTTKTPTGKETVKFRQPPSLGEMLVNLATGKEVSDIPPEQRAQFEEARKAETLHKIELDRAKAIVLETGEPQAVDNVEVYLDNGVVKVRKIKGSESRTTPQSLLKFFNVGPVAVEDQILKLKIPGGARARKIHEFLQAKSDAEKDRILADWEAKGIITDEVYDQLMQLVQP